MCALFTLAWVYHMRLNIIYAPHNMSFAKYELHHVQTCFTFMSERESLSVEKHAHPPRVRVAKFAYKGYLYLYHKLPRLQGWENAGIYE